MRHSTQLAWQDLDPPASQPAEKIALQSVYLHPGQIFVATEPSAVTTILGSCVSVCLWDPALGTGGMNHYLLPTGFKTSATALRYGNIAIEHLLDKLLRMGCCLDRLQAKVFGGACVLEAMRGKETHLGAKNAEIAKKAMADAGIPVAASDVGGDRGRKLIFHTHDGTAMIKLL